MIQHTISPKAHFTHLGWVEEYIFANPVNYHETEWFLSHQNECTSNQCKSSYTKHISWWKSWKHRNSWLKHAGLDVMNSNSLVLVVVINQVKCNFSYLKLLPLYIIGSSSNVTDTNLNAERKNSTCPLVLASEIDLKMSILFKDLIPSGKWLFWLSTQW